MTRLKWKKELSTTNKNDARFGTPMLVAEYRAKRLGVADTIIEVGAGAGFQTAALAKQYKKVIAIDSDNERLGRANKLPNVVRIHGNALDHDVFESVKKQSEGIVIIFLDPERPATSQERTLAEITPNIQEFIALYSTITQDIAIELPPFLKQIPFVCEKEYLSIDGVLNRLTIYLGSLKRCEYSVVQLPEQERVERNDNILQEKTTFAPLTVHQRYLIDPDAALIHAGFTSRVFEQPMLPFDIGNKTVYLAEHSLEKYQHFAKQYMVLSHGSERKMLEKMSSLHATIILHGKINNNEQAAILQKAYSKGKQRIHVFLGKEWYVCKKIDPAAHKKKRSKAKLLKAKHKKD